MNYVCRTVVCLFVSAGCLSSQDHLVRDTEALDPEEERAALSVPEGFEIGLFASEPMINKPINLAVDSRGRVWVSSTVEYPYAAEKNRWSDERGSRVSGSLDSIKILEDTDGDGSADRVIDFADGLNIPTGILPWHRPDHADGCIAWSIPNIWYFADTDGDGKADLREVLFGPLGYEKDTHGMCSSFRLGTDGWVYATHGFNNTSHLKAKDGSQLELHSGNVFRFHPDGSRVELWSRGQVNPFGLAFDRRGNLYSADCHSSPVYQLIRGAVYPSFGKPHDGLGFGPAMIEHTHGSTGIAGIVYVDRGVWGESWNDHVIIGNPVTSRVNLDRVVFTGTTPRAEEKPDFIVSHDPWFRPVDLTLAPDGALYVADFYNRIIGHYEVPLDHPGRDRERGRIWRVVKKGERPAIEPLAAQERPLDTGNALRDSSPWIRRSAAAALQEEPSIGAIGSLRVALKETPDGDSHLRYSLRLALRECLSLKGAYEAISEEGGRSEIASISLSVNTPEAASWLLGFPGSEDLSADFPDLRRRHIARYGDGKTLGILLEQEEAESALRDNHFSAMAILGIGEALEERQGGVRDPRVVAAATRLALALLEGRKGEEAAPWRIRQGGSATNIQSGWEVQLRMGEEGGEIPVLSSLKRGAKGAEQFTGMIESRVFPLPERLTFLLCGHRGVPGTEAHQLNIVRLVEVGSGAELARAFPPRSDKATLVEWVIPEARGREVRIEVEDGDSGSSFAWLGIGEVYGVNLPVDAFAAADRERILLQRLARYLVTSAPIDLRDRLRPFLPVPAPAPSPSISPEEQAALDRLIADRVGTAGSSAPDVDRGKALFAIHCATCHRVGGEGGLIGPQLDGIGSRGLARLAEDILDPNRNVDAHFRLSAVTRNDGSVMGGFVVSESGEVIHLLDAVGQRHRVLKSEVKKTEVSARSLMPANFGEVLNPEEFRDLAGWLLGK